MDEPRTHYQLSFTVRQGLLLFVALLGALGVAYLFGLLTGLSGRTAAANGGAPPSGTPAAEVAAAASPTSVPEATPAGEALELPRPVRGVSPRAGARRAAAPASSASSTSLAAALPTAVPSPPLPTPSPGLQLFEDEGGPEPTLAPPPPASRRPRGDKPVAARAASSSFWVQALSASSEKEARALKQRLESHGYSVAVVPGPGPSGKRVFRVRAGPYGSREEAERAAAKLKARDKVRPWVVPPGK